MTMSFSRQTPQLERTEMRKPLSSAKRNIIQRPPLLQIMPLKPLPPQERERIKAEMEAELHTKARNTEKQSVQTTSPENGLQSSTPHKIGHDTNTMEMLFRTPNVKQHEKASNINNYLASGNFETPSQITNLKQHDKATSNNSRAFSKLETPKYSQTTDLKQQEKASNINNHASGKFETPSHNLKQYETTSNNHNALRKVETPKCSQFTNLKQHDKASSALSNLETPKYNHIPDLKQHEKVSNNNNNALNTLETYKYSQITNLKQQEKASNNNNALSKVETSKFNQIPDLKQQEKSSANNNNAFSKLETAKYSLSTNMKQQEKTSNNNNAFVKLEMTPKCSQSAAPRIVCSVDVKNKLNDSCKLFTIPESPKIYKNKYVKSLFEDTTPKTRKLRVNATEFVVLRELGRGGSSEVLLGLHAATGQQRAIKCVSINNPDTRNGFIKEVEMLSKLQDCDRIIKMYDYEIREETQTLYVVLEVGLKDLSKLLLEWKSTHIPPHVLYFYWMEMLLCVKQTHARGIIHSDLKPANFLITENGIKLIDFGIAQYIPSDVTSVCKGIAEGSFNYISPEALTDTSGNSPTAKYKISYKSDVWSLGCILYQMVYGRTPFQHIKHMYLKMSTILDPNQQIPYGEQDWIPARFVRTVQKCLQFHMKSRPSLNELIAEYVGCLE